MKRLIAYLSLFILLGFGGCLVCKMSPTPIAPVVKGAQGLIQKSAPIPLITITNSVVASSPVTLPIKHDSSVVRLIFGYLIISNFIILYALRNQWWKFQWPKFRAVVRESPKASQCPVVPVILQPACTPSPAPKSQ
jgi:hypothetical protein